MSRSVYRDILKHGSIYGVGQILGRLAGFLLLPVYTRYLTPADYGCLALLDLTTAVLGILLGTGLAAAVTRYHFEAQDDDARDKVWITGLSFVGGLSTLALLPLWISRKHLADFSLGPDLPDGTAYFALVLPTLWCSILDRVSEAYLRVRKWSGMVVGMSLGRLALNITLNLMFLIAGGMGVKGVLLGNLLTGVLVTALYLWILFRTSGHFGLDGTLIPKFWRYGWPIILTSLLTMLMHRADNYLLRVLGISLHDIGIYAIAYTMGQAINTVCMAPFEAIWNVLVLEVADRPDRNQIYAKVFQWYTTGLIMVMLAASLFIQPILSLLVTAEFLPAAALFPIICLGYLFFSLTPHFHVPARLAKQTAKVIPGALAGATTNIATNLLLIPHFGLVGAAWATVAGFAALALSNLAICRRIERIEYPFAKVAGVAAVACLMVVGQTVMTFLPLGALAMYTLSAAVFLAFALIILVPHLPQILDLLPRLRSSKQQLPLAGS